MLLRLGARRLPGGLRRASTGPVAAYNALVDAEKIQRDGHQLEALVPLQRLHEEIVATGYAPADAPEPAPSPRLDAADVFFEDRFGGSLQS